MHLRNFFTLKTLLSLSFLAMTIVLSGQSYDSVAITTDISTLHKGLTFELNKKSLKKISANRSQEQEFLLPYFNDEELTLVLTPIQLHSSSFTVTEKSKTGEEVIPYKLGTFYKGYVKGEAESFVTLAIQGEEMSGLINMGTSRLNLGKIKNSDKYILYHSRDLKENIDLSCSTLPNYDAQSIDMTQAVRSSGCNTVVDIYFECDYQMYQNHNSNTTTVTNYVNSLFAEIATLYANENIMIQISQVSVWSTNDGYSSGSAGLTSFANALNNSGFNGDLAVLLVNDTGSNGGVAYVDQLCGSNPYAYCDLVNSHSSVPTYSWDVQVVTHEMGHCFGSSHTHDCVWGPSGNQQIDDCGSQVLGGGACYNPSSPIIPSGGGTIMSYCHLNSVGINFNTGFGTQPGNLIRAKHSTCMCDNSTCAEALVIDTPGTYNCKPDSGNGASSNSAAHADWFEFTPTESGTISASSCNEGADTRVLLHSGSCSSLNYMMMSDDDCTSSGSGNYASEIIDYAVTAGVTYYIEWDSRWSTASFDWVFDFTASSGGGAPVTISCPQDYIGSNACTATNYHPNTTGYATGSTGSSITYSDNMTSTACTVVISRTWTATDANGNSATCSQYIDLNDNTAPVVSNCANTINVTSDADCNVVVSWTAPTANDGCGNVTSSSNYSPGTQLTVGSHSVYYYFTDACNNTANCAFTVNVADGCSGGVGGNNNWNLDPCDAINMTLNGNIITDTYNAESTINASGIIHNSADPIMKAGQEIEFMPGFELRAGATLEALIEDCQN